MSSLLDMLDPFPSLEQLEHFIYDIMLGTKVIFKYTKNLRKSVTIIGVDYIPYSDTIPYDFYTNNGMRIQKPWIPGIFVQYINNNTVYTNVVPIELLFLQ
jgi:hypothetical protein